MYWTILFVALGGALGASARYLTGLATAQTLGSAFPFGTMTVNIIGSFIMGIAFVFLMGREQEALRYVPFVMTGLLGGFTTFSAFSLDFWLLIERERLILASVYLGGSVVVSVFALIAGVYFARAITG